MLLRGRLEAGRGGPTFRVAEHEIDGARTRPGRHTTGLVPVYPGDRGPVGAPDPRAGWGCAASSATRSSRCRRAACRRRRWPGKADALAAAHLPESLDEVPVARRRLAFEELFLFQLALVMRRRTRSETREAERLGAPGDLVRRWLDSLPFELTAGTAQGARGDRRATSRAGRPMQRLLMGEVGSGKTVVALYAMLRAAEAGMQAALMAPTETLAEQHYATMERLVGDGLFAGGRPPGWARRSAC